MFDLRKTVPWDEKVFRRDEQTNGKTVHIVGG